MPGPKPPILQLTDQQRSLLEKLVAKHSTPQQISLRARLVLAVDDGLNNCRIGRRLGMSANSVRVWRNRWLSLTAIALEELSVEERLADIPRAGKPSAITAEQFCRIIVLACELPETCGQPVTHWSPRELANEIVRRGILHAISPRHAARLLKKGLSSRIGCAGG